MIAKSIMICGEVDLRDIPIVDNVSPRALRDLEPTINVPHEHYFIEYLGARGYLQETIPSPFNFLCET